jgi:hypothetical protein
MWHNHKKSSGMKKIIKVVFLLVLCFAMCKTHAQNNFSFKTIGNYTVLYEGNVPCSKSAKELKAEVAQSEGWQLSDSVFVIMNADSVRQGVFIHRQNEWEMILVMEEKDWIENITFSAEKISFDFFSQKIQGPIHVTEIRTSEGWRLVDVFTVLKG